MWPGTWLHAFLLDVVVSRQERRQGIGTRMVQVAAREGGAARCEWLHVDFEDHLRPFHFGATGSALPTQGVSYRHVQDVPAAPGHSVLFRALTR